MNTVSFARKSSITACAVTQIWRATSVCLAAALALLAGPLAFAQEDAHPEESGHETTHEYHKNLVAFFIGATHENRRDNSVALGIEYERRLSHSFGVGIVAERTFGNADLWVYALPLAYHTGRWKLYAGPGIEDGEHGSESLIRVGVEYGFEIGAWEISPQLDMDFVDDESTLVLGVTFGKGF